MASPVRLILISAGCPANFFKVRPPKVARDSWHQVPSDLESGGVEKVLESCPSVF